MLGFKMCGKIASFSSTWVLEISPVAHLAVESSKPMPASKTRSAPARVQRQKHRRGLSFGAWELRAVTYLARAPEDSRMDRVMRVPRVGLVRGQGKGGGGGGRRGGGRGGAGVGGGEFEEEPQSCPCGLRGKRLTR